MSLSNNSINTTLSIIVVTFNSADHIRGCLESIINNGFDHIQIIVVDNASVDDTRNICKAFQNINLIYNNNNMGFAKAVNIGIKVSTGQFVLLLNPDIVLPINCLKELVDILVRQPQVGMIGSMLVQENGSIDLACRRNFPTTRDVFFRLLGIDKCFPKSKFFNHYNPTYVDMSLAGEVECISGAFMLVRREAIQDVGLMDEAFFLYGEDVDWAFRFKLANWKIYYYPTIKVLHYKRGSSKKNVDPKTICAFYDSAYLYYLKYLGPWNSRFVNILIRFTFNARKYVALFRLKITKKWF